MSKEGQKLLEKIQHSPEKDEKTLTFLKDKIASAEFFIEAFNQREQTDNFGKARWNSSWVLDG